MLCSDVMKELVQVIAPDASVAAAAARMRDAGVGFLPVCARDGRVLGVVTDRDIAIRVCAERRSSEATPIGEIMTEQILSCLPSDPIECAERLMIHEGVRRVLVLDRGGVLRGVISLVDLAHFDDPLAAARALRLSSSREFRLSGLPGIAAPPALEVDFELTWASWTALHPGTSS